MSEGKTVAGAFAKIESHEELCAERYETIHEKLGDLKTDAATSKKILMGVLLALLGWMGVQLWEGRDRPLPQPQTQTTTTTFAPPAAGSAPP